ncbi:hypothetical protein [Shimia sp. SDUM112013]|uniref:hypothetical protein n=1 Tax=Shimia sp. SDUM112013 TaxID=3136160 RepID=UPI0032EB6662
MRTSFLKATMGFGLMALAADQISAQQAVCAPREIVLHRLQDGYGETRQAIGLGANNSFVEWFASEAGSWTLTMTFPDGSTCILAAGQAFENIAQTAPAPGDPA